MTATLDRTRGAGAGRMRVPAIGSEAVRNVSAGTAAAGVFALALALISAGLAFVDASTVLQIRQQAAEFATSGAAVRVLQAQGRVDAAGCDRLAGSGSIRAAGALGSAAPVTPSATPNSPITAYRVTPGLASVIGLAPSATGAWISADLARSLGVRVGDTLTTPTGALTVGGTFAWPDDGRDTRFGYAVLEPIPPTGALDECWADVWPPTDSTDELLRSATLVRPDATTPLTIGQLNNTHGSTLDAEQAFRDRPTRYAAPGSLAAGLVLGFLAVRRRRLEYAAALHSGQRRSAQVATALLEVSGWAVASLVIAAVMLVVAVRSTADAPTLDVLTLALRGPVIAVLGACLGTLGGLTLVHEDQLFRYFKER